MVWRLTFLMGHVKRGLLALFLTWPGFATAADNAPAPPVTTPSPATAAGTTDQGNTKDQKNKPDGPTARTRGTNRPRQMEKARSRTRTVRATFPRSRPAATRFSESR
jgi:hypothetical protein